MENKVLLTGKSEWHELSRKVSAEGSVLLKNDNNVLPIKKEKLAVFGRTQINTMGQADCVNISEGLISGGIKIDDELFNKYIQWTDKNPVISGGYVGYSVSSYPEMPLSIDIVRAAKIRGSEKAVIVLGRTSCENCDLSVMKGGFLLSEEEEKMINAVCDVFDHVILILNISCSIDLSFLETHKNIESVLFTGWIGEKSSLAIADILTAKTNPSGKLTFTMARKYSDYPSSGNFGQHEGGLVQNYEEDIFVGYRYFDTFNKNSAVAFPFGFGLSYTEFSLTDVNFIAENKKITVSVKVTNTGTVYSGREVVQVYFSAPQLGDGAKLGKPYKELCQFAKTHVLTPGRSEVITISFPIDQMASYDDTGILGTASAFVMEKGTYRILVSHNGIDLINAGCYIEQNTRVVKRCESIATTLPRRLLANGNYEKLPQAEFDINFPHNISPICKNTIPVSDFYISDRQVRNSLNVLKKGESVTYRVLPGICGRYNLSADGKNPAKLFEVSIDGITIMPDNYSNSCKMEITLPLKMSEMRLTALADEPQVSELYLEKVNVETKITCFDTNILSAKDMYEGSFYINLENFIENDGSVSSCITNVFLKGMYVMYKLEVEKEGYYNFSFRYSYTGKEIDAGEVMTIIVSNVINPIKGITLHPTQENNKLRKFVDSDQMVVFLPRGTVYFRIASRTDSKDIPFPDLANVKFSYNPDCKGKDNQKEFPDKNLDFSANPSVWKFDNLQKKGIQLKDVYCDRSRMSEFLTQLSDEELAKLVSGDSKNAVIYGGVGCTYPLMERGIPPVQTVDSPMDLSFSSPWSPPKNPSTLILSSSFDKDLYTYYGRIMGDASNCYKVGFWLAPAINIIRNPCGGRSRDYSSEDPYLSGIYAKCVIDGVSRYGVAAILKHYCANNSEFERLKSNSRVSERALREIYMKAFEIVVTTGNVWGIMTSYNSVNDIKVCENISLISDIPRNEWKWDGVFMTDWWNDTKHVNELLAGHDIKMTNGDIHGIVEALKTGKLTRKQVYVCAERVINTLLKLKVVTDTFI